MAVNKSDAWIDRSVGSGAQVVRGGPPKKASASPLPTSLLASEGKLGGGPRKAPVVPSAWVPDSSSPSGYSYRLQPGDRFVDLALTYIGNGDWFPAKSGRVGGVNQLNQANLHIKDVAVGHQERLRAGQMIRMPASALEGAKRLGVFKKAEPGKWTPPKPKPAAKPAAKKGLLDSIPTWARWAGGFSLLGVGMAWANRGDETDK